jgi:hypothetical protein
MVECRERAIADGCGRNSHTREEQRARREKTLALADDALAAIEEVVHPTSKPEHLLS